MVYPCNAPFQKLYPYGVWVLFLKKTLEKEKNKKQTEEKGEKDPTSAEKEFEK